MIENSKNPVNCCKFCGWEFHQETIQKINENKKTVLCEFCGVELDVSHLNPQDYLIKRSIENVKNTIDVSKGKEEAHNKRISKFFRNKKYSLKIIFEDSDFPKIFKENLIVVISRLIYIFLREWEQENRNDLHRMSVNKSIINFVGSKMEYLLSKRISNKFLQNLHKLTIEEFESWLRLLQKKIESNEEFCSHFLKFFLWLEKIVFRLVSDMWEMKNLPKTLQVIRNDLKSYDFNFFNLKSITSTSDLLYSLKQELEEILPQFIEVDGRKIRMFRNGQLSWGKLSFILCNYSKRLDRIRRNLRTNPDFKLALDELQKWEENIRSNLGLIGENAINIIEVYKDSNENLPKSSEHKVLNFHPNLKRDYFENITTKNQAYWLGFVWAEIYIGVRSSITLDLSKRDEILMDRFIIALGLNPIYKTGFKRKKKTGIKNYVRIRFKCKKIEKDLLDLGYKPAKLKQTQLPTLGSRELYLAFLLGFFDGDGKQGTTAFHLGSKKILDQIKEKFNIPHEVYPDKEGKSWYLSLGAELFNEMLYNYENSLKRKRKFFRVSQKESFKRQITKEELEKVVSEMQLKEICKKYGIYRRIIVELCDEWGINRPPSHYWHQKKNKINFSH
jgi:hypothetical protein